MGAGHRRRRPRPPARRRPHLADRGDDRRLSILPVIRELGIGLLPYSPPGRGVLAGQIRSLDQLDDDDFRQANPRLTPDNLAQNLRIVDDVQAVVYGFLHPMRAQVRKLGQAEHRPLAVDVLRIEDGVVREIVTFHTGVFERFDLPAKLPPGGSAGRRPVRHADVASALRQAAVRTSSSVG